MKIGILETGDIHEDLLEAHGNYPKMFERMLHAVNPDIDFISIKVCAGEMPNAPSDADGWIITGSKHGVYEDLPWVAPISTFLRACMQQEIPVAGICFGHQLLAQALGGKVVKSDKGWGIGVQSYDTNGFPDWMSGAGDQFTGHAVHQDQVTEMPDNATLIASSNFCPNAAFIYGDINKPLAITVQSHPEIETPFIKDLIDVRLKGTITKQQAKDAHKSLGQPLNNTDWARWISTFFEISAKKS